MIENLLEKIFSSPRRVKRTITAGIDFLTVIFSLWLAFSLRLGELYHPPQHQWWVFLIAPVIAIPVFIRFGLYRAVIRYLGLRAIWTIINATLLYSVVFAVIVLISSVPGVPRTVYGLQALILFFFASASRFGVRWWISQIQSYDGDFGKRSGNNIPPVIIYGAGASGIQLAAALKLSRQLRPVAYIDDDPSLLKSQINGLTIYPFTSLGMLIQRFGVSDLLLAIPSISRTRRNEIIRLLEPYAVHVRTLPGLLEIAEGKVKVSDIQEVDVADLLGRDQVIPDQELLNLNIKNKTVMVTGAGGSIGSELCRQIANVGPKTLILYELNEFALYTIEKELKQHFTEINLVSLLGNVKDQKRLETACHQFDVETIYHAAAYKHVPLVEANTIEGIQNNIFGTLSAARAAMATNVDTFVLISTDKAVRPTNTMGASKRFAELILQALSQNKQKQSSTRFTMVRFGNVLGSSGSVVPLFREQIANGGPITVTDNRIIRYFMTIPEAAELVIQAGAMGQGGDVFVLDMGQPVKILDLAKRMIHLSGFVEKDELHPDGDIEIVFTGLRPGEKLYEELLIGDNVSATSHQKIMRAEEQIIHWDKLEGILADLKEICIANDCEQARALLEKHVSGFKPQCAVADWLK